MALNQSYNFHFILTFLQNANFPWPRINFPDITLTLKNFFSLTISWPVATMWNECVTIAVNRNLSNCEIARKQVFRGFDGTRTRGLCVRAEVLYQLSYEDPYTGGWPIYWVYQPNFFVRLFRYDSLITRKPDNYMSHAGQEWQFKGRKSHLWFPPGKVSDSLQLSWRILDNFSMSSAPFVSFQMRLQPISVQIPPCL